ncbi:Endothelin-converting enzyme 1 [Stylophora pistillata]|uniref:Endothelin-converting enzyme 1 n=1 Tax=Stylophora pistillata TaxID=50429 RepID=A0A2B4R875_STYPI|nr:Endothelin-converting enzyme 1 [Stylophora pistillata]
MPKRLLIDKMPEQPLVDKLPKRPPVDKLPKAPIVDKMPNRPLVDKMPEQPLVDKMPKLPLVDKLPKQPLVDKLPKRPLVDKLPKWPLVDKMPKRPLVDKMPKRPLVHKMPKRPLVDKMPKRPLVHKMPKRPPVDKLPKWPLVDKLPKRPLVDKMPNRPLVDKMPKRPLMDKMPKRPLVDKMPQRPLVDKMPKRPLVDKMPQRPLVDKMPKRPLVHKMPKRPLVDKMPKRPLMDKMPKRPLMDKMPTEIATNGNQTLNENIADNGGLKLAFKAYKSLVAKEGTEGTLPGLGLTEEQLFFIGFAQPWCSIYKKKAALLQLQTDSHTFPKYRIFGPLHNYDKFAEAYKCKAGSPMNPAKKCTLWSECLIGSGECEKHEALMETTRSFLSANLIYKPVDCFLLTELKSEKKHMKHRHTYRNILMFRSPESVCKMEGRTGCPTSSETQGLWVSEDVGESSIGSIPSDQRYLTWSSSIDRRGEMTMTKGLEENPWPS